jgi:hypothetical protein
MLRNKKQNSELHALISKLGIDAETKEELVYNFTKQRTKSSSQMLIWECQALINELRAKALLMPKNKDAEQADKLRKKLFSIAREMGWVTNGKVDQRLHTWVLKYGFLKKALNDYSVAELPKLITQMEYVLKDYYVKPKV